ncbi:TlpA family protein disulfide reductase [Streptomyces sp. NPDC001480]|uniref:TlpA family protein disulfide reductase n=1 Tax=Streptomyces sp. NPDC001480 TaxID=3364577 RepID=UPI0036AE8A28
MPFLVTAVVLIALLCLLNLLLTFGVIRKLRAQGEEKADKAVDGLIIPAGSAAPAFSAVTTAGERITRESLGETMLGFFSPDCRACKERLPLFVEQARAVTRGSGRSVLAVVHGTEEEAREQVAALADVAHVVVEPGDGPLGEAFDITGYPVFGLITADGTLGATTFDPARLPAPSKAAV